MGSYPKLSRFMGVWPEMAVLRKFGVMNAEALLFRQAELAHLEDELSEIRMDNQTNPEEKHSCTTQYWKDLSAKDEDEEHSLEYQKSLEIRAKLAEYSKAAV